MQNQKAHICQNRPTKKLTAQSELSLIGSDVVSVLILHRYSTSPNEGRRNAVTYKYMNVYL